MRCVQNAVCRWNLRSAPDFCHFFLQLKRQSEGVLALALLDKVLHPWRASNRAGAVPLGCWCGTGIRRRAFPLLKLPLAGFKVSPGDCVAVLEGSLCHCHPQAPPAKGHHLSHSSGASGLDTCAGVGMRRSLRSSQPFCAPWAVPWLRVPMDLSSLGLLSADGPSPHLEGVQVWAGSGDPTLPLRS